MRLLILAAAAGLGLLSLLLQPVPAGTGLQDSIASRALLLVQPTVLTVIMLAIGAAFAPRIGLGTPWLDAWLAGRAAPALTDWLPVLTVAIAVAALLVGFERLLTPALTAAGQVPAPTPLLVRVLYGGVTEEIIARWGLMSLFAWGLSRVLPGGTAMALAALLAALLFAAGHLPLLFATWASPPQAMIAAVLLGNTLAGLGFGWLYARAGLEAAIVAHALSHALAAGWAWLR